MARKKQSSNLTINDATVDQITAAIADLLNTHAEEIGNTIDESDNRNATVTFGVELDCSESAPTINVKCRFSSTTTDKRTIRCDDPNQPNLFTMRTPEQEKKEKAALDKAAGKGKKNKKAAEAEANGEGGDKEKEREGD